MRLDKDSPIEQKSSNHYSENRRNQRIRKNRIRDINPYICLMKNLGAVGRVEKKSGEAAAETSESGERKKDAAEQP